MTFKVLDSLSPAPWDAAIRASRGPARMPPRRPASRGLPSSGDPDRSDSHGGGALGEARCLAVPRWAAFYVFIDVAWRWCDVRTASHRHRTSNRQHGNIASHTRGVARPRRPNTVWFSEITRPLARRGDAVALWPAPGPTRGRGRGARGRGTYVLESPRAVAALDGPPVRGPGPGSPAPHMMTRARARPRTGAARGSLYLRFSGAISIYPWHAVTGRRRARGDGAQFAITLLLHDWR